MSHRIPTNPDRLKEWFVNFVTSCEDDLSLVDRYDVETVARVTIDMLRPEFAANPDAQERVFSPLKKLVEWDIDGDSVPDLPIIKLAIEEIIKDRGSEPFGPPDVRPYALQFILKEYESHCNPKTGVATWKNLSNEAKEKTLKVIKQAQDIVDDCKVWMETKFDRQEPVVGPARDSIIQKFQKIGFKKAQV